MAGGLPTRKLAGVVSYLLYAAQRERSFETRFAHCRYLFLIQSK
jgi:hypothetical protein